MGSKPTTFTMGMYMGRVTIMIATISMKQPITRTMSCIKMRRTTGGRVATSARATKPEVTLV